VDEQEHPAEAEGAGASAPDATPPVTEPAIARPERRRRGEGARKALTSRGAGWVAAAVLAGAVVALSAVLVTAPSTTVLQLGAARSFRVVSGGGAGIVSLPPNAPLRASWVQIHGNAPPGSVTIVGPAVVRPGSVRVEVPANAPPGGLRSCCLQGGSRSGWGGGSRSPAACGSRCQRAWWLRRRRPRRPSPRRTRSGRAPPRVARSAGLSVRRCAAAGRSHGTHRQNTRDPGVGLVG
jgi:hypothetical protein